MTTSGVVLGCEKRIFPDKVVFITLHKKAINVKTATDPKPSVFLINATYINISYVSKDNASKQLNVKIQLITDILCLHLFINKLHIKLKIYAIKAGIEKKNNTRSPIPEALPAANTGVGKARINKKPNANNVNIFFIISTFTF